jgi:microcystin-dependent protein
MVAEPFLAEIRIFSFGFAPLGWAMCNGQTLAINQNQALFALLGTTYGGNGITTFALPNLQGRIPLHVGNGIVLGEFGGESTHTLSVAEIPGHTHVPVGTSAAPSATSPAGNVWAPGSVNAYSPSENVAMSAADVLPTGGSQAHENMPPYTVLNFCIALQGIFPSQN